VRTSREAFLAAVRRELARGPARPAPAPTGGPDAARRDEDPERSLARFRDAAERVGAVVHRAATLEAAGSVVLELARARDVRRVATWSRRALGPLGGVADRLAAGGLEVFEGSPDDPTAAERAALRPRLASADLGLTGADLAVAETGSLVLVSGPGKGRTVSLLPACHVAVLGRDRLVPGLAEAGPTLAAWQAGPGGGANLVIVTGPSRTADIELTLTRGVHGPRELHVVVVDGGSARGASE
jgi:L-lactate utilization protein LutC